MPVRRFEFITREEVRARSGEFFVFGDNIVRKGFGGQAAEMRGEPNSLGVATLYAPGDRYRKGDPIAINCVMADLSVIAGHLARGAIVNIPTNLPGSGIADLANRWPELQALIASFVAAAETVNS